MNRSGDLSTTLVSPGTNEEPPTCRLLYSEESQEIFLLNARFEVLDRAILLWPYASGTFADLTILSQTKVRFAFLGPGVWELELFDAPRLRLPFFSEPLGTYRPFGFSRRFRLRHRGQG
ncbi:MAG TPA: hypothetical protein VKT70_10370 [Stellaceae bacterium]|nr:hypothetical protein [Stellaceae bacterium]